MFSVITSLLKLYLSRRRRVFIDSLRDPKSAQESVFEKVRAGLIGSAFGKAHKVEIDDTYEIISKKIPVQTYEQIEAWIAKNGAQALFSEEIIKYQRTSGSSGPNKDIPYTKTLLRTFHHTMELWIADTLTVGPALKTGKIFYSITPQGGDSSYAVQQVDDTDYLNPILSFFFKKYCFVPQSVKRLQTTKEYLEAVSLLLLLQDDLEIVSLWHPTLLEAILDYIQTNRADLTGDLEAGRFQIQDIEFRAKPMSKERRNILLGTPIDWERLWPKVKLISCWENGNAVESARRIKAVFPKAFFQGKGLGATESPITIPMFEDKKQIPLIDSIFYEFQDDCGHIYRLHELEINREYRVIIWPLGGFSRYQIGDAVRVYDFHEQTPCLEFIGRENGVSDLVGEKLTERFVIDALGDLPHAILPRPYMLLPTVSEETRVCCYTLLIQSSPEVSLTSIVERKLRTSYQYDQARRMNQLDSLRVIEQSNIHEKYFDLCLKNGMCLGDIKCPVLLSSLARAKEFIGYLEEVGGEANTQYRSVEAVTNL